MPTEEPTAPQPAPGWGVVVPVKALPHAKSRLAALGPVGRRELALAFACDVVLAALSCDPVVRVLVVTSDAAAAAQLAALGADVFDDPPGGGLNAALLAGARRLIEQGQELPVAALSGDLPALRAEDLARVLSSAGHGRCFVPDAEDEGTTLLTAAAGTALAPLFGLRSRAAHAGSGARVLAAAPGVRRDVDTPAQLEQALALGVGPHTARVVAAGWS